MRFFVKESIMTLAIFQSHQVEHPQGEDNLAYPLRFTKGSFHALAYRNIAPIINGTVQYRHTEIPFIRQLDAEFRQARANYRSLLKTAIHRDRRRIDQLNNRHAFTPYFGALAGAVGSAFLGPAWLGWTVINSFLSGGLATGVTGKIVVDWHVEYESAHHRREWVIAVNQMEEQRLARITTAAKKQIHALTRIIKNPRTSHSIQKESRIEKKLLKALINQGE